MRDLATVAFAVMPTPPPTPTDTAVTVAVVSSTAAVLVALLTTIGVIVVPVIQKRRARGEIDLAKSADARSDTQLDLDGMRADAESARAGQAAALQLLEATRSHYVSLLEALERQAGNLQATIDSLLEVNRGLTESLRVAQSQPDAHAALVASLEEQLRLTDAALQREREALADAEETIEDYQGKVLNLEAELLEATASRPVTGSLPAPPPDVVD